MSAFDNTRMIEAKGLETLSPYIGSKADGYIVLAKGALARVLQQTTGDVIFSLPTGRVWSAEIKVEQSNRHGNLFLETWSNRNLESRESHIERGSNMGWLFKMRADLLLYYFLEQDALYVFDLFKLKQWAFGSERTGRAASLYRYPEKPQSKYAQANDTHGRCVPISDVMREVGGKLVHPRQLPLFAEHDEPFEVLT